MMATRSAKNVGATGTTIIGIVGSAGPPILRAIGFVEMADDLLGFAQLLRGTDVNWQFVWFVVAVFGSISLVAINWDLAQTFFRRRRNARIRVWDLTIYAALAYIGDRSIYKDALHGDFADKIPAVINAFCDAAKSGKVIVHGKPIGEPFTRNIKPSEWRNRTIELDGKGNLVCDNEEKKVYFTGLMASASDVRKIWPPHPNTHALDRI